MTTTATVPGLNIYSDFECECKVTRKNATTGVLEAATGLASMAARISLTKQGAALGSCTVSLTERGTTGIYAGTIDTATLVSALTAYLGQTVYVVFSRSGDVDHEWAAYIVRDQRAV